MKEFLKHNFVNTFASVFIGLGNWGYNYLILLFLSGAALSNYSEFVSIYLISGIPAVWFNYMFLKYGKGFLRFILHKFNANKLWFIGIIIIYFSGIIIWYLKSGYSLQLTILALILFSLSITGNSFKSVMQERLEFVALSRINIAEVILKILFFVIAVQFFKSEILVYLGLTVQLALGFYFSYRNFRKLPYMDIPEIKLGNSLIVFAFSVFQIFFQYMDIILVRNLFVDVQNTIYVQASQISKLILFFSLAFLQVLIPTLEKETDRKAFAKKLYIVIGIILGIASSSILGLYILWDFVYKIFKLDSANLNLVILMICSAAALVIMQTLASVYLVRNNIKLIWLTIIAAIVYITISLFMHSSLENFVLGQIVAYLIISVLLGFHQIVSLKS